MNNILLAIFSNRETAEPAVIALRERGYNPEDISIIVKDKIVQEEMRGSTGANIIGGAITGIASGGMAGLLVGVLVTSGVLALPGLNDILVGEPLTRFIGISGIAVTIIRSAVTGAIAGAFVGGVVGLGVPPDVAHIYEDRIKEGAILVAVPLKSTNTGNAREILNSKGATEVRSLPFQ